MGHWRWVTFALVSMAVYAALVWIFGFQYLARPINFARVSLAIAVLIIYVPALGKLFREVPAPRRDYLLAGIILTWTSAVGFALWNEAGRQFGVNTSIFSNPIAGLFSLMLVGGAAFHILAPDMAGRGRRWIALAIGLFVGALVALVAPLFWPRAF